MIKNRLIYIIWIAFFLLASCSKNGALPNAASPESNSLHSADQAIQLQSTDASILKNLSTSPAPQVSIIQEEKLGAGAEATVGKTAEVHYTGWLGDGKKFESSVDRGKSFEFRLGAGQVVPGWDPGILGMRVGGKRKFSVPPELAYGAGGAGALIPPNSTLIFEVELLAIK